MQVVGGVGNRGVNGVGDGHLIKNHGVIGGVVDDVIKHLADGDLMFL
jgi:hypothetical protein